MIKSLQKPNTYEFVLLPRTTNNRPLNQHVIVISSSDYMNLKKNNSYPFIGDNLTCDIRLWLLSSYYVGKRL